MNTACPSATADPVAEAWEAVDRAEDEVADRDRAVDRAVDRDKDKDKDKDKVVEEAADKVAAETAANKKQSPTLRNTQQHNVALTNQKTIRKCL